MKKNTKGTILFNGKDFECGVSVEALDTKSKLWILDGWSIDGFGNKKNIGIGIAKDLYKTKLIEIDAGIYATKELKNFFNKDLPINVV